MALKEGAVKRMEMGVREKTLLEDLETLDLDQIGRASCRERVSWTV